MRQITVLALLLVQFLSSPVQAGLPQIDYAAMFFQTSSASSPIRKVSALPATCTAIGSASSSNAVLYQGRVYICTSTNTWTFAVGVSAALTAGRLPYVGTGGILADSATATLDSNGALGVKTLTINNSTDSNVAFLVSGSNRGIRIGTGSGFGRVEAVDQTGVGSYQAMLLNGSSLNFYVNNASVLSIGTTGITFDDGKNFAFNTTTGTKFGTSTSQKFGVWNATPIAQPSSTGEATGFTAGAGTNVTDQSTFTGNVGSTAYRINDIVKHLKNIGLIAQ